MRNIPIFVGFPPLCRSAASTFSWFSTFFSISIVTVTETWIEPPPPYFRPFSPTSVPVEILKKLTPFLTLFRSLPPKCENRAVFYMKFTPTDQLITTHPVTVLLPVVKARFSLSVPVFFYPLPLNTVHNLRVIVWRNGC